MQQIYGIYFSLTLFIIASIKTHGSVLAAKKTA